MKILYHDNKGQGYFLFIEYHYFVAGGELVGRRFNTLDEFQDFMTECHPEISISKFVELFNGCVATLMTKANEKVFDPNHPATYLHCGICGDELFVSRFDAGVVEKMNSYKDASDKANANYIETVVAHSWSFNMENNIMRIRYWYDPSDSTSLTYKIHIFNDKVILDTNQNKSHSIIRADEFYVHCEGTKKPS